jgi:hypothetical protein
MKKKQNRRKPAQRSTLRERIVDVTEFLDDAAGISWTWFSAALLPTAKRGFLGSGNSGRSRAGDHLYPVARMGFDRLFSHQLTQLSPCRLVVDGDGYPTPPGGLDKG